MFAGRGEILIFLLIHMDASQISTFLVIKSMGMIFPYVALT